MKRNGILDRKQRTSEQSSSLALKRACTRTCRRENNVCVAAGACKATHGINVRSVQRAPPETFVQVIRYCFGRRSPSDVATLAHSRVCRETAVEDDGDVVAFDFGEVPEHGVEGAVGDPCYSSFGTLAVVVVGTKDFDVLHSVGVPPTWRVDGAPVSGKVDEDGIIPVDVNVVHEVRHESVFNRPLRRLAVGQQLDLVTGNVEVMREPLSDALGVIDAGLEVPDVAGLVFVNTWISSASESECET